METEIEPFFARIYDAIRETLSSVEAPSGQVYSIGFWLFYCDYFVLSAPCLAYNTRGNEQEAKWCPPEWQTDVDEDIAAVLGPIYSEISDFMDGRSDDDWEFLIDYQWRYYCGICHALTKDASALLPNWDFTDDFVAGIFEEREGDELYQALAKASVGEKRALKLGIV